MKFWILNSLFMLAAVGYAACLAPHEATNTLGATGLVQRQVELVKLDSTACSRDYCLGFDGQGCDPQTEETRTANQESAADVAERKNTDTVASKNGAEVKSVAGTTDKPTYLIYFTAAWCGPCQHQKPVIQEIANAGKYKVYIVDVDNDPKTAQAWGVNTVPTVSTVVQGIVTYRGVGAGHSRAFLESKMESQP